MILHVQGFSIELELFAIQQEKIPNLRTVGKIRSEVTCTNLYIFAIRNEEKLSEVKIINQLLKYIQNISHFLDQ